MSSTYFTENKRPFRNLGNTMVLTAINLMFHTDIKDVMTGYRAFSYQFVKTFPVISEGYESKLNTYSDGMKVLLTIVRLLKNYRPLGFFSLLAGALIVLATLFFVPVLHEYLRTGLVAKFPTLIVCGFVVMASIMSFFAGMVLDTIKQKNRQVFEMNLHKASDVNKQKEQCRRNDN